MPCHAPLRRHPSKPICTSITLQKTPAKLAMASSFLFRLQRSLGNQTIQRLIQRQRLDPLSGLMGRQAKLTVSGAEDQYEQEADKVANRVMTMPNPASSQSLQREGIPEEQEESMVETKSLAASITPLGQRQSVEKEQEQLLQAKYFADSKKTTAQRESSPEEKETLQMQATGPKPSEADVDVEKTMKRSQGGGSSLPDPVRNYMEPRFGADFSGVRVHQGEEATKLNKALHAQAFTVGKDIYLGAGNTAGNSHLLAHELTHVVQQTGQPPASAGKSSGAQKVCTACATRKPGEASCPACAAKSTSLPSSSMGQGTGNHSVQRAPSATSYNCWSLRAKCYYYCTKSHLWRWPPDYEGFKKCKYGCCDWAFNQCQKDGTWPCIFPGM